jgi:hypothetical protein
MLFAILHKILDLMLDHVLFLFVLEVFALVSRCIFSFLIWMVRFITEMTLVVLVVEMDAS